MSMTIGKNIKITISGGSHEKEIGVRISGFPFGVRIDYDELVRFIARRKAANNIGSTAREEKDIPVFQSGISDGVTNGEDIVATVINENYDATDYIKYIDMPRPSHADYVSTVKYGKAQSGGGIFSGRMTVAHCIAGGLAVQYLKSRGINITSEITRIGNAKRSGYDFSNPERNVAPNDYLTEEMKYEIASASGRKDSVGGEIQCVVTGLPVGIGEPVFDGLESTVSKYIFSIPAVKGVEFGRGFAFSEMCGSNANDSFIWQNGVVKTSSNNNGGINGGLSNGMPLVVTVAVKPTPSIGIVQNTVSLSSGESVALEIKGRHDVCIVPRAVAVVESAVACAVMELYLEGGFDKNDVNKACVRAEIDNIDDEICELLNERLTLAETIGKIKKQEKLPVEDKKREKEIITRLCEKYALDSEDVEKIYNCIFSMSKKKQK